MKLDRRFAICILAGLFLTLVPVVALAGGLDSARAGEAAQRRGDNQTAIQWFTRAIQSQELSPKDLSRTYYNRGLAHRRLNQLQMAVADYSEAVRIDPSNSDAFNNRAFVYLKLKQFQAAARDAARAITINPNKTNYYVNRALAFREMGQLQKALADINQAIRLDPARAVSYYTRSIIYRRMGNKAQAGADMARYLQMRRRQSSGQASGSTSGK